MKFNLKFNIMSQFKTKQEAEEHIKQIAEDVAKKFEKDMMQMSDEELDILKQRLNDTVSEVRRNKKAEEFQQTLDERRNALPKEEQVLFDIYVSLLDQSRVNGSCHYAYVYLNKEGKYQVSTATRDNVQNTSILRFYKDMKEKFEQCNQWSGTFVCFLSNQLLETAEPAEIDDEFFKKLQETYDFNKFFAELDTKHNHCIARQETI